MSRRVSWIVADVTEIEDIAEFDLWHDRAVFHVLTSEADRRRYAALAERTVRDSRVTLAGQLGTSSPGPSSSTVQAVRAGRPTVEVNPGETPVSDIVSVRLPMGAAAALDAIWRSLERSHPSGSR